MKIISSDFVTEHSIDQLLDLLSFFAFATVFFFFATIKLRGTAAKKSDPFALVYTIYNITKILRTFSALGLSILIQPKL